MMMSISWMMCLVFWVVYVVVGFAFTVLFMRNYCPKIYKCLIGEFKKSDSGKYYDCFENIEAYSRISTVDTWEPPVIVTLIVILWPIFFIGVTSVILFKVSSTFLSSMVYTIFNNINKKIPNIKIVRKEEI